MGEWVLACQNQFLEAWASVPLSGLNVFLQEMWLSTRVVMGPDSALRMSQTTRSTRAASVGVQVCASFGRAEREADVRVHGPIRREHDKGRPFVAEAGLV